MASNEVWRVRFWEHLVREKEALHFLNWISEQCHDPKELVKWAKRREELVGEALARLEKPDESA